MKHKKIDGQDFIVSQHNGYHNARNDKDTKIVLNLFSIYCANSSLKFCKQSLAEQSDIHEKFFFVCFQVIFLLFLSKHKFCMVMQ